MPRRIAFSLIELLVVISVIATLVVLVVPAITMVRESSRKSACIGNLRQWGMAVLAYATANDGILVPCMIKFAAFPEWGANPNLNYQWLDTPLAGGYLDQSSWSGGLTYGKQRSVDICPSDRRGTQSGGYRWASYGMNECYAPWLTTMADWSTSLKRLVKYDKAAQRVMVIEANEARFHPGWGSPPTMYQTNRPSNYTMGDPYCGYNWRIFHPGNGANLLFMDGHVSWHDNPITGVRVTRDIFVN